MVSMEKSMTEMSNTTGAVARTVEHAASNANRAIDKASDAARPAVDQIAAGVHQAVGKLADAVTQAAATLDAKGRQLREAQVRVTESCRVPVRDKPLTALGIALAAGFLVGWLLSRR